MLARGLFWRFVDEIALGEEAPVRASEVRLWHPALAAPEEVHELRRSLLQRELVQPFKQAYREVYLVAPAELETRVYSNRFAAHVLHYPETYALLKERGWGGSALGPWDGGYETAVFREFRGHGLRAEWWLENAYAGDWTGGTLANLATTDQVRFVPLERRDREPIPLAEVPPLVSARRCATSTCSAACPRSAPTRLGEIAASTGSTPTGTSQLCGVKSREARKAA